MKHAIILIMFASSFGLCGQAESITNVHLIGHKLDHPYGTHMYLKGCRLLANCLNQNSGVRATVSNGWPSDPNLLKNIDAIVFYSSPAADIKFNEKNRTLEESLF